MRGEDARLSPKMAVQKFLIISNKPIKLKKSQLWKFITQCSFQEVTVHCLYFVWFPLAWIISSIQLQRDVYKSFTSFTVIRCLPLLLRSHNSFRLCGFFSQIFLFNSVHICSIICKPGLWAGQSFNSVTPFSFSLNIYIYIYIYSYAKVTLLKNK